jgi:hypothetical protein
MNTIRYTPVRSMIAVAVAAALFAGCAAAPTKPAGSAEARAKLTALQGDPTLANRAPVAMKDAENAVREAELPQEQKDAALGAHRVYIADRKVDTARAQGGHRARTGGNQFRRSRARHAQRTERKGAAGRAYP